MVRCTHHCGVEATHVYDTYSFFDCGWMHTASSCWLILFLWVHRKRNLYKSQLSEPCVPSKGYRFRGRKCCHLGRSRPCSSMQWASPLCKLAASAAGHLALFLESQVKQEGTGWGRLSWLQWQKNVAGGSQSLKHATVQSTFWTWKKCSRACTAPECLAWHPSGL